MKAIKWVLASVSFAVASTVTYWLTEGEEWIPNPKISVVRQREGDSTTIDVPLQVYVKLPELTLSAQVRTIGGRVITETDQVDYLGDTEYKFVTPNSLKRGRYEAFIVAEYQLNPLRRGEIERLMAIIYVEPAL
jgi:hypothetical protein